MPLERTETEMAVRNTGEHLSDELVDRYKRRELEGSELLAVDDHLFECDACHSKCCPEERLAESFAAFRAKIDVDKLIPGRHIEEERLSAFVRGMFTQHESEDIEKHLRVCPRCRSSEANLRSFHSELSVLPAYHHTPSIRQSFAEQLFSPLLRPRFQFARAAGIAALVIISLMAGYFISHHSRSGLEMELAQLKQNRSRQEIEFARLRDEKSRQSRVAAARIAALEKQLAAGQSTLNVPSVLDRTATRQMLAMLTEHSAVARGGTGVKLVKPVATAVLKDIPEFTWAPVNGATGYVVTVTDLQGSVLITSPVVTNSSCPPASALPRGQTLLWEAASQGVPALPHHAPRAF